MANRPSAGRTDIKTSENQTPTPADLGAPGEFDQWRPHQRKAWQWGMDAVGSHRHIGMPLATGYGKSLIAYLIAKATGKRTVILTSRLGLQDQYRQTFFDIADVRGRANYRGVDGKPDSGKYRAAVQRARDSQIVVTTYAFWIAAGKNLGRRDMVVLDEGDQAFDEMCKGKEVNLSRRSVEEWDVSWPMEDGQKGGQNPQREADVAAWEDWVTKQLIPALKSVQDSRLRPGKRSEKRFLLNNAERVKAAGADNRKITRSWLGVEESDSVRIGKVWPTLQDAESLLFRGAATVLWMSGTLRPKSLEMLGVSEFAWQEFPHPFPKEIRPVLWVPTIRAVESKATEYDWRAWQHRIDQIIQKGTDGLGIIHSVSYGRAERVLRDSRWRDMMISHNPSDTARAVQEFLAEDPPAIMVSPVLTAGWDMGAVRYQVLGKIPWPDSRDIFLAARKEHDKDLPLHMAVHDLVQQAGRIVRGPNRDDKGTTLIIDDGIEQVTKQARRKGLVPDWFEIEKAEKVPSLD